LKCAGLLPFTGINSEKQIAFSVHLWDFDKAMTMKRSTLFLLCLLWSVGLAGQAEKSTDAHHGPVKWLSFEQAVELSKKEKKYLFVDVYATWCGPCKMMDKYTFADSAVAQILNNNFYPVKLNAEQREDILFDGTTFKFMANGASGYHQLAAALLNNKLQYPTFVFMNEELKIIQAIPGFHQPPDFHKIIQFIGEGHYKKIKWEQWQLVYKSPYTDKLSKK